MGGRAIRWMVLSAAGAVAIFAGTELLQLSIRDFAIAELSWITLTSLGAVVAAHRGASARATVRDTIRWLAYWGIGLVCAVPALFCWAVFLSETGSVRRTTAQLGWLLGGILLMVPLASALLKSLRDWLMAPDKADTYGRAKFSDERQDAAEGGLR